MSLKTELSVPFIGGEAADNTDAAIVSWLENVFSEADKARKGFEAEWIANVLFLTGQQWEDVEADKYLRSRRLPIVAPQVGKIKLTINHILPLVRQAASQLMQNMAQQVAIPATQDEMAVQSAELATDFLRFRFDEDIEAELRQEEVVQALLFGRSLRRTIWDPNKDSLMDNGQRVRAGDIETRSLDPFRYWMEPGRDKWRDVGWIIEADIRSIDELEALYDKEVPEETAVERVSLIDRVAGWVSEIAGSASRALSGGHDTPLKRQKSALLKHMYMKPTAENPNGKYFAWANGVLLVNSDLPHTIFPFVPLDWFWVPGRSYPMPFVSALRDPQKESNTTYSQIVQLKNNKLRGDMVITGPGDVTQEWVKDEAGNPTGAKIVRLPQNTNFKFMQYDLDAQHGYAILDRMWAEAMKISGVHEPSLGSQPVKAVTATEIAVSKEADMTGLALPGRGFGNRWCEISSQKLVLAKEFYKLPRMIRTVGENQMVNANAFYGSDLRDTEDVRTRTSPILTQAQIAEQRSVAAGQGLYGPYSGPQDKRAKLKALQNSGIPGIEEEVKEILGGLSMSDLDKQCAELDAMNAELQKLGLQVQLMQAQAVVSGGNGGGEQQAQEPPAVDQFGQPVQAMPQSSGGGQPQQMAVRPPTESINFKDLPYEGQRQMAAQAGIQLSGQPETVTAGASQLPPQ